jgi:3-hydroxyacyl-[acyl-carrier-protein] dehydratase
MEPDVLETLVRSGRKRPLFEPASVPAVTLRQGEIERLIPHREPLLLLDNVEAANLDERLICGRRRLDPVDPIFAGHFPGDPLYPGALQLEIIGQLALCMFAMLKNGRVAVIPTDTPRPIRALKIHHAAFLEALRPRDDLVVLAKILDTDEYTGTCAGQIVKDGTICCVGIMEVYFVEA